MRKLALIAFVLGCLSVPALAQMQANPSSVPSYYSYLWQDTAAVKDSKSDTLIALPNLAGASWVSYTMWLSDSVSGDIYTDYCPLGASSWATKDTMTISNASETASVYERLLRSPYADKIGGLAGQLRLRIVFSATGNDTAVGKFRVKANWKP